MTKSLETRQTPGDPEPKSSLDYAPKGQFGETRYATSHPELGRGRNFRNRCRGQFPDSKIVKEEENELLIRRRQFVRTATKNRHLLFRVTQTRRRRSRLIAVQASTNLATQLPLARGTREGLETRSSQWIREGYISWEAEGIN